MNEELHPDNVIHHWYQRSSHRTSDGIIHYDACPCGAQRVRRANDTIYETTTSLQPSTKQAVGAI